VIYFAEVSYSYGGGWATDSDPKKALRAARMHVGATAKTENAHYILEFPDGANPRCSNDLSGGWSTDVSPLRVVERAKVPAEVTDDQLLGR
jgi:hypothetical protein